LSKRLFIAVDIDGPTRDEIGRISAALRERMGRDAKVTWVQPDRMHLTLQFFGDADDVLEGQVLSVLTEPIREPPFDLSFHGLGSFPERRSPRILWLGIGDGFEEIRRVHQILVGRDLGRATGNAGRTFKPHLTLARFRTPVRARVVDLQGIRASAGPSRIDRVTLYESRLSPKGPTYLRVAEAPLQP
jgi:2'-5' RNA ligase